MGPRILSSGDFNIDSCFFYYLAPPRFVFPELLVVLELLLVSIASWRRFMACGSWEKAISMLVRTFNSCATLRNESTVAQADLNTVAFIRSSTFF